MHAVTCINVALQKPIEIAIFLHIQLAGTDLVKIYEFRAADQIYQT